MFCFCGTLLDPPSYQASFQCKTCGEEHDTAKIFKPIIITKQYEQEEIYEVRKVKGATVKYQCPKCGAEEMTYNTIQTRSADEGQTVFYTCECGYKEKMNS